MQTFILLATLLVLTYAGFAATRSRSLAVAGGHVRELHSLPGHYGLYGALWFLIPALAVFCLWVVVQGAVVNQAVLDMLPDELTADAGRTGLVLGEIARIAAGQSAGDPSHPSLPEAAEVMNATSDALFYGMCVLSIIAGAAGFLMARNRINADFRARNRVERVIRITMLVCASIAVLTTVGIVLSLVFETLRFFAKPEVSILEFFFGLNWSPQTALRADQVGSSGAFGAVPLFAGTMLITLIAMLVAVPVGLFSAVYLTEFAAPKVRAIVKPLMEVLAGVPTVVYGFFAALIVAPQIRGWGEALGLDVASESALAAGVVMGVMIIPFVSSLSDDVINAVPQSLRDGSAALGATKAETIVQVIFPAALPGIVGAVLLAVSRAVGETMIVVMAAGLAANLTINPLEAVTTVTVQIVTLLVGDQEFDSAKTLAAFALGLMLFFVTLALNVVAFRVVRKYREKYD
jgi:phosphate transport system permease protein